MNEEDEEFAALEQRLQATKEIEAKRAACKHRWEETDFGKKYWAPGTYQYTCRRCGSTGMFTMEEV